MNRHCLVQKGWLHKVQGFWFFILLISFAAAYAIDKYLNKNDTPEETLRRAIVKGEIVPFYQPIVNGREGTLRGVEVLARWKHPTAGYISPASFIPVAEKSGTDSATNSKSDEAGCGEYERHCQQTAIWIPCRY